MYCIYLIVKMLTKVNNVSRKWRLGAQCPTPPPWTTHKPQPGEVDHPSGLPYPHPSHEPPTPKPLSTRHTEKSVEKQKRKKKRKHRKNGGGREGTQKHTRNKTRETLDDISKLRTWKCVRIQLQTPADRPAYCQDTPGNAGNAKGNTGEH